MVSAGAKRVPQALCAVKDRRLQVVFSASPPPLLLLPFSPQSPNAFAEEGRKKRGVEGRGSLRHGAQNKQRISSGCRCILSKRHTKVRIFSQRRPSCPLQEEQNDCFAGEETAGRPYHKRAKGGGEEESGQRRSVVARQPSSASCCLGYSEWRGLGH